MSENNEKKVFEKDFTFHKPTPGKVSTEYVREGVHLSSGYNEEADGRMLTKRNLVFQTPTSTEILQNKIIDMENDLGKIIREMEYPDIVRENLINRVIQIEHSIEELKKKSTEEKIKKISEEIDKLNVEVFGTVDESMTTVTFMQIDHRLRELEEKEHEREKPKSIEETKSIVRYKHHGKRVFVRSDLKGKHRDYSLCRKCKKLNLKNPLKNCYMADIIKTVAVKYNLVLPVWECPMFVPLDKEICGSLYDYGGD